MENILGQIGEALFYVSITRFHGRNSPVFRPQFLGDKWPAVDFVVELMNYPGQITPYFFVQVKTTRQGYTKKKKRLKVKVPAKDMQKLASFPAPTYIVGIDENTEEGYLVSANGEYLKSVSSLSTRFPINKDIQDILWQEVKDFWEGLGIFRINSKFADPDWRIP